MIVIVEISLWKIFWKIRERKGYSLGGINMLATDGLLESLLNELPQKLDNDNYDLGEVLRYCCDKPLESHSLRCSDGSSLKVPFFNVNWRVCGQFKIFEVYIN